MVEQSWQIKYTKRVQQDLQNYAALADSLCREVRVSNLKKISRGERNNISIAIPPLGRDKTKRLLNIIAQDPYTSPPNFEKLCGFENVYSRRINIKHRLVYEVFKEQKIIKVISLWGHIA